MKTATVEQRLGGSDAMVEGYEEFHGDSGVSGGFM
jgi:hypothetical protein